MARVAALHHVAFQTTDLRVATRFYVDQWGLSLIGGDSEISYLASTDGNHHNLIIAKGGENRFEHVGFAVADSDALNELVGQVRKGGLGEIVHEHGDGEVPGEQAGILLRDPDGILVKLVVPAPASPAVTEIKAAGVRPGPLGLGHVVLRSTRQAEQEEFYALLGLYVTDRTSVGMSFLRCNEDHHSLALSRSASSGLHHVAWDIARVEDVEQVRERMEASGHQLLWGIGRHGPGNNVFSYYQDPLGHFIEMYAEMEKVSLSDETPTEIIWGPGHGGDISGRAGPVPAIFKG